MKERFFNTAGPIQSDIHYFLPPLERFDQDELFSLIAARKYFILHAPRQTGKTSCLLALRDELNRRGEYACVYANVEAGQSAREDVAEAMRAILGNLGRQVQDTLRDDFVAQQWPAVWQQFGGHGAWHEMLSRWAQASARPLVLLLDEVDALIGDTLISLLRQLRSGYDRRPAHFPSSVVLCGVRDVRDYRIHSAATKEIITGGSAFNIKSKSLRLGNFTLEEIHRLYQLHTAATGQVFESDVFPLVWELTAGQPWLVNALAYEACFEMKEYRDRTKPITTEVIQQAKEELILRRDTHLDQLADKLQEDRVRRVIAPLLAGEDESEQIPEPDVMYVRDLGLVTTEGQLRIANRIYQEIIPRELTFSAQLTINQQPEWYITPAGKIDVPKLLAAFQQFFREHSEHWVERFEYKEAGPQLLLQAFLQRIVNGGGRIEREYGLGRKRTDLLWIWPYPGGVQRAVIELKILRQQPEETLAKGLEQTWGYADRCGADEAHFVLFDIHSARSWEEKIYHRTATYQGRMIEVWGL
jgi:hypothetical protein